ncbi:hypothetical protein SAMN00120144_2792 [Hymenobacter roseosalivarius DSM 11622]|uniref:Uncharacterized protein n=2 Tax=Hymenobacter roseosalivarius TaxID=89967 RepID=A0A1W1W2L0_9BACT|nr:hypothetical protein SAMN00120144_2792 [Hymenobacter roseosalivarius DSM 11622]
MLAMGVVGACTRETEPGPELGLEYYPVQVGAYRVYAVVDSIYQNNRGTATRFQFRERVDETFIDAAGDSVYRVVRSRRTLPTDAWRDDSVLIIKATPNTLLLTRSNRRTVELVFPVRAGRRWNANAYNSGDTITAEKRAYDRVGEPFELTASTQPSRYAQTVTTADTTAYDLFNLNIQRQVYAREVGPIHRWRRRYVYGCPPGSPADCSLVPGYRLAGNSRVETLIESGKL